MSYYLVPKVEIESVQLNNGSYRVQLNNGSYQDLVKQPFSNGMQDHYSMMLNDLMLNYGCMVYLQPSYARDLFYAFSVPGSAHGSHDNSTFSLQQSVFFNKGINYISLLSVTVGFPVIFKIISHPTVFKLPKFALVFKVLGSR